MPSRRRRAVRIDCRLTFASSSPRLPGAFTGRAAAQQGGREVGPGPGLGARGLLDLPFEVIDGPARDLQPIAFDRGVDREVVAVTLEPALRSYPPLHGRRAERRQVVEGHVGVDGEVGLQVAGAAQRTGDAQARVGDRSLQRIDGDVEGRRDAQDPGERAERDGLRLAPPRAPARPERDRPLADAAVEAEAANDERALLGVPVLDRSAVHPQDTDDQRLVEGTRGLSGRARPHLEGRPLDLDGAERQRLSPEEAGRDHQPGARRLEAICRALDHEVVDLAGQSPGDDVHATDAAARAEGGLDAALDVPPEDVLREKAESDEDQGQNRQREHGLEDGAGASCHAARRPVPSLTLSG